MPQAERYTITAALPYTNGPVHIGHLAGVYIPADIYTRYLRLKGKDVLFVCGSDEHGVAIPMRAKKEGISPKEVIDKYHTIIKKSFEEFGISFDNYSRTSAEIHHETASDFFTKLYKDGKFVEEVTEQLYDAKAQQFLADRFVVGTCPRCGHDEAYGDQCENCGSSLNATDLINPKSVLTGTRPSLRKTRHWFLPLDQYDGFLRYWILEGYKDDWKPNVYGQCKSWIDDGLRPRAVTRDLDWGIPVPLPEAKGKVLYVWFDAPIGYISSTKEWAERTGRDWEPYWKDKNTQLVHFIGKDNIVFHCIIFPSMLKAHGNYVLPANVPANEFLNLEGNKISTSKNWAVWLHEYLIEFPEKQDVLRYVLTANAPETKDNDFTWKDFQARNNNELVANYGNFVNRVLILTKKYFGGMVPEPSEFTEYDHEVLDSLRSYPDSISSSIEQFRFREGLHALMNLSRTGNKYLGEEKPWELIKNDEERVKTILFVAMQVTAALSVLSEPFLPFTTHKLQKMLELVQPLTWKDVSDREVLVPTGHRLGESSLLFNKIEDKEVQAQLDKLEATKRANLLEVKEVDPIKEVITYDDFVKLDMRIGTVLEAEKMPKAKKLLVLKVDIGEEVRTIVSGIAEFYTAKETVGRRVVVLANLAPRKLKGIWSEGRILMTEDVQGRLVFVGPESEEARNGARIA